MIREEVLRQVQERFKDDIIDFFDKTPKRVFIEIKPESITEVVQYILKERAARFNIATALDARYHTEIIYHFTIEDINLLISFRVKLDKKKPKIDSITPILEGANWIEREMNEMLGIEFVGHPDMRRLLLADDWPEGIYPLRCDYKEWDEKAIRDRGI